MVLPKLVMLLSRFGVISALTGGWFAYKNHDMIDTIRDRVWNDRPMTESGFFQDHKNLYIMTYRNEWGNTEVYLYHKPTGSKVPIMKDMYPDSRSMLETMIYRTESGRYRRH